MQDQAARRCVRKVWMVAELPQFMFMVCQYGAEAALKQEMARQWPQFRLSFSRPGFVTFKLPQDAISVDGVLQTDFDPKCVFARSYGFSLGKLSGTDAVELAARVWQLVGDETFRYLHVWQRDTAVPGDFHFEPGVSELASSVGELLQNTCPAGDRPELNTAVRRGQRVLDCVLVEPAEWWLGQHWATTVPTRWPGGVMTPKVPSSLISRAYLKTSEALDWSRLPVKPGDRCFELGSAPGGSCQALLDRGLRVWGVDPAEMDPQLMEHPRFTHIRKRVADVKRREFVGAKWLVVDLNVAPSFTLDAVEDIVTHSSVKIRGMLLTLKLSDWALADEIPVYLDRIRRWGYSRVRARQLAFNRREICVAAQRASKHES